MKIKKKVRIKNPPNLPFKLRKVPFKTYLIPSIEKMQFHQIKHQNPLPDRKQPKSLIEADARIPIQLWALFPAAAVVPSESRIYIDKSEPIRNLPPLNEMARGVGEDIKLRPVDYLIFLSIQKIGKINENRWQVRHGGKSVWFVSVHKCARKVVCLIFSSKIIKSKWQFRSVCLRFAQPVRRFVRLVRVGRGGLLPPLPLVARVIAQSVEARNRRHLGIPRLLARGHHTHTLAQIHCPVSWGLIVDVFFVLFW